jgi:hypothetical protein
MLAFVLPHLLTATCVTNLHHLQLLVECFLQPHEGSDISDADTDSEEQRQTGHNYIPMAYRFTHSIEVEQRYAWPAL